MANQYILINGDKVLLSNVNHIKLILTVLQENHLNDKEKGLLDFGVRNLKT